MDASNASFVLRFPTRQLLARTYRDQLGCGTSGLERPLHTHIRSLFFETLDLLRGHHGQRGNAPKRDPCRTVRRGSQSPTWSTVGTGELIPEPTQESLLRRWWRCQ